MSWSGHRRGKKRRGYHHGDLKEAMIGAALDLIAEKGILGVTFAEAARAAGVSPAAPYRHYRDRDALIADVARRGFERLEADLSRAWNGGGADPAGAFEDLGRAYLAFARREPAYYAAMYESGLPASTTPELNQASEGAFGVIKQAAEAVCMELPKPGRPPTLMVSLHMWAMMHGIAALFGRGDEGRRALPMPPEDLLEAGMLIYLRGLGPGQDG